MIDRFRSAEKSFQQTSGIASPLFLFAMIVVFHYSGTAFARSFDDRAAEISNLLRRTPSNPRERARVLREAHALGEVVVPRLGLKAVVVEGVSPDVLQRSAGHVPDTAMPGQWGNVALAAHRSTFFRPLRKIRLGDIIVVKTADASFLYQVERTTVVNPSDTQVLRATGENSLTLITCFPFDYVGVAPQRFIVRAREVRATPEDVLEHQTSSFELQNAMTDSR